MSERIISLRPHHIDRFVSYYHKFQNMFDNPLALEERYGGKMVKQLRDFFDMLASGGTGEEYVVVKNGLDTICSMCPIKRETCSDLDSLSVWNGSGQIMQDMDLREGWIYPLREFLEKVKQLYPNKNPVTA